MVGIILYSFLFNVKHGFVFYPAEEDGGGGRVRTGGDSKSAVKGGSKSEGGKQDVNLRRACSLSDLNKPAVARRILPSPPNNGTHIF